jgi:hypothetical protein
MNISTVGGNTAPTPPAEVPVVAKVALHAAETSLLFHEAEMYARAARLQDGALPRVLGVFASVTGTTREGKCERTSRCSW